MKQARLAHAKSTFSFDRPDGLACAPRGTTPGRRNDDAKTRRSAGFQELPSVLNGRPMRALLARESLVVSRAVEWANVAVGFETRRQFELLDAADGANVGRLVEETGSHVARQLLKARRGFHAEATDAQGTTALHIHRPPRALRSHVRVTDASGREFGETVTQWHPWKRQYDLLVHGMPFAYVRAPALAWDFVVEDVRGNPLAVIGRNFQGLGLEMFTDKGMYAVTFGAATPGSLELDAGETIPRLEPQHHEKENDTHHGERQLQLPDGLVTLERSLSLEERAVVLATAVSVDFDYFSRHSQHSMFSPLWFMPMHGEDAAQAPADARGSPETTAESQPPPSNPVPTASKDRSGEDLGGDDFPAGVGGTERTMGKNDPAHPAEQFREGGWGEESPSLGDAEDLGGDAFEVDSDDGNGSWGDLFGQAADFFGEDE